METSSDTAALDTLGNALAHPDAWSLEAVAARHEQGQAARILIDRLGLVERWGSDLATTYAQLDDLARTARKAAETRPNTDKARAAAQDAWERFCGQVGVPTGVVVPGLLDAFSLWLLHSGSKDGNGGYALATARAHLKNLITVFHLSGVDLPERASREASEMLTLAYAQLSRDNRHREGRGQAEAVSQADLIRAVDACNTATLSGLRDRAALLTGWMLMSRASELADLQVGDVKWLRNGAAVAVTVRASKTSSSARTNEAKCYDGRYCVVTALREYIDALAGMGADTSPNAPLLRAVDRWGKPRTASMTPDAVTNLVAAAAERAGLDYRVTGHSLRSGSATDALTRLPLHRVAKLGGWSDNSAELLKYLRDSRNLDDRASVLHMNALSA